MKKIKIIFLFSIMLITLTGCATQRIAYKINDIPKVTNSIFKDSSLVVWEFRDEREGNSIEKSWYQEKRLVTKDRMKWYFNHNDYYKNKDISSGITKMIVKHLACSRLFQSVILADNATSRADYILEGAIRKFEGFKEQSAVALIGSQFGLIGALTTAGVKSEYRAHTMLIDVRLIETNSNEIVWEGDIEAKIRGKDYADAYGWSAYTKANSALKEVVNQLIKKIHNEIQIAQY